MAALNSITGEDYFFDACRVKTLSIHLSGILRVANVLYVNIDNLPICHRKLCTELTFS